MCIAAFSFKCRLGHVVEVRNHWSSGMDNHGKYNTKNTQKEKSCIKENRNLNFYKTFYWEKNKQEFADTIA